MNNRVKKVVASFLIIFISIGFMSQSYQVCVEYFGYQTTTRVELTDLPEIITAPSLIICFPLNQTWTTNDSTGSHPPYLYGTPLKTIFNNSHINNWTIDFVHMTDMDVSE